MTFRIFDRVLADHTWTAAGRLCIAHQPKAVASETGCAKTEIASLLGRLILRSKSDRIMCRAVRRLAENPSVSLDELARELAVTERYLLSGLRAVLGVDPQCVLADRHRQADS
jgi:hypothetical protein